MTAEDTREMFATCTHCGKSWWIALQGPPEDCPEDAQVLIELIEPDATFSTRKTDD